MPNSLSELHVLHAWEDNQITEHCTQGEFGSKILQFKLIDKDGDIDLSNCIVQYAVIRPDKTEDLLNCTVQNGVVKCNITYSATSVSGLAHGEIRVIGNNNSGIVKFYGVNLRVYNGVSDEVIEQSDEYSALIDALQKVVNLQTGNIAVMDALTNGDLPNGTNPVASGNLKTYLRGKYTDFLRTKFLGFKYAHEVHSSSYNADTNPVDVYNDSEFEGVYIDDASELGTCYIIKNLNGTRVGILICANVPSSADYGRTQIALYYSGYFRYRYKKRNGVAWDEWTSIELQKNKDSYNSEDTTYFGITNNVSKYPSSKSVYQFIQANAQTIVDIFESITNSVLLGYDTLAIDKEFNIHKDIVETYLNDSDYSADTNYTISKLDGIDYGYETHGRPNKETVTIPTGGVAIKYKDTVTGREWTEPTESTTYIQNLIPNHIYIYQILDSNNAVLKTGTAKASGKVRMISAGGDTYNIRDIGGWAADGGTLKYGVVYRGGELNSGISINSTQQAFFKHALGIRDEIDLRATGYGETALGVGVDYVNISLPYAPPTFSESYYSKSAEVIKRLAYDISNNRPAYIHCQAGADRTGIVCLYLEAICGVSQNDIDRDYELTSFSKEPGINNNWSNRIIRKRNQANSDRLKNIVSIISAMEGINFNDKVVRFLLRTGVTIDEINAIRFGLIDGNPSELTNPYGTATITKTLSRVFINNKATSVKLYQPFEAELTTEDWHKLSSVTITMGGNNAMSYYIRGKINIPRVTGNIVITASADSESIISVLENKLNNEDDVIKSNHIDDGAVTTDKIADESITQDKLSGNSVGSSKIMSGAIKTSHIADGSVTERKLSFTAVKYVVAENLPSVSNANADTDYYIGTLANGYTHYRLIDNRFIPLGNDSYTKSEIDALLKQKTNVMPWEDVQAAVRRGQAEKLFPIGYEFEVNKNGGGTIPFVVLGYDTIAPQDTDLTHSMILGTKYIFGSGNSAYTPIQFDAPEALTYATNLVGGRTYLFNWTGSSNMDSGNWFCYIPNNVNGSYQIVLNEEDRTLSFYLMSNGVLSSTAAQTLPITQSSSGTNIVGFTNVNDINRVLYGSNNYAQSAVRQLLNSSASIGNVWIPKTVFDRPPAWADTLSGFMSNIDDSEFMQVVATASVPCRTNDLFEVDNLDGTHFSTSSTYTVNDKFFLLSLPEISGGWDNANIKDGEQLDYYVGATQIDYIKYDKNGTPRYSFLRSPRTASGATTTQYAYCVNSSSGISVSSAKNIYGIAPACIIA